jgi:PEP-CTERM motif
MNKIEIFLFIFLLILSVNGNTTEIIPIDLVLFDNSSSVGEIHTIGANKASNPESEQTLRAVPEPMTLLILGAGLIGLGIFARKELSHW